LFIVFIVSCASEKPKGKTEAEVLFKEAKNLMAEERYLLATEKLNNLKNQYPYSYYATPAELLQADILFLQESYIEAAAAYLLFKDFHPKHEQIAYVTFRIAESYYNQLPDTYDRDLESAIEAIKYYSEILTKFPTSKFVSESKEKIEKANKMLQNKEKYVADFYFKTEVYQAARWRYLDILKNFENKKLRSHAMQRVIISSYYLKEYEKCIDYSENYSQGLLRSDKEVVEEYKNNCKRKL
jgi:outer membrane protein assembly factor BamD